MRPFLLLIGLCAYACVCAQNNIGKADNISGVYIFNDCTPLAEYDVLGEVSFNGSSSTSVVPTFSPSGSVGSAIVYGEAPQYNAIRNGLVASAVMANRQVEGIILKDLGEGTGRATMIKFRNPDADNSLAKVNNYFGLYVFTDCKPINDYVVVKIVKGKIAYFTPSYGNIRNDMVKKASRKDGVQACITHFVEGGYDNVEAIKFLE